MDGCQASAKSKGTQEGGDRVDADGIPLHLPSCQQKALLEEAGLGLCSRIPFDRFGSSCFGDCRPSGRSASEICAAFCRKSRRRFFYARHP